MVEFKLPVVPIDGSDSERRIQVYSPEPIYEIKGVKYYDSLPPEPAEKPRQTLLPMTLVGDWVCDFVKNWNRQHPDKKKSIGWSNEGLSLKNPQFGSAEIYAVVEYDNEGNLVNFVNDVLLWQDGRLDERTGIATPGSVIAPIEKREDGYFVHCFWQWRPAAWDININIPPSLTNKEDIEKFKALHTGMWMLTVPGGFAKFVGDSPEITARREALEEAGIKIDKPVFASRSFNRASVATLVNIGFSTFEITGGEVKEEGEKVLGKIAVRIDKFESPDAMSAAAVDYACKKLGLVSYMPQR